MKKAIEASKQIYKQTQSYLRVSWKLNIAEQDVTHKTKSAICLIKNKGLFPSTCISLYSRNPIFIASNHMIFLNDVRSRFQLPEGSIRQQLRLASKCSEKHNPEQ